LIICFSITNISGGLIGKEWIFPRGLKGVWHWGLMVKLLKGRIKELISDLYLWLKILVLILAKERIACLIKITFRTLSMENLAMAIKLLCRFWWHLLMYVFLLSNLR
jgi:hypothetical protein